VSRQTVIVAFEVDAEYAGDAEKIVEDRLARANLLWQNDSSDAPDNLDPINTYAVLPLGKILLDAL
jgi:hypothetical protein